MVSMLRRSVRGDTGSGRSISGARPAVTLIELIGVIVLLGIVGAVTLPAFLQTQTPDPTTAAAAPLIELLRFAERSAVLQNVPVTVTVDPATAAYHVAAENADSALADGRLTLPAFGHLAADSLRARFVFDPTGRVYADSIFISSGGVTALVHVYPWTGAIGVARW